MSIYSSTTLCTVKNSPPLDIANCNVFFEPKFSAGRPLRATRPSDAAAKEECRGSEPPHHLHPDAARPQEPPQPSATSDVKSGFLVLGLTQTV